MFEALRNIAENVRSLNQGALLFRIFSEKEGKEIIIFLNQSQLFDDSVRADGVPLGPYSDVSNGLKSDKTGWKGKRFGNNITLYDEGDFYESFRVTALKNGDVTIDADPIKENTNLFTRYGDNIIGLTNESFEELKEYITPVLFEAVRRHIYGLQ